jgi:Ca2+-binding RTX toxin-like protein
MLLNATVNGPADLGPGTGVMGTEGPDTLLAGAGNQVLTGGAGPDRFVLDRLDFGHDVITDFSAGDVIDVSALGIPDFATLVPFLTQAYADTQLSFTQGGRLQSLRLLDTTLAGLDATRFVFNTDPAGLVLTGTEAADMLFGGQGSDRLLGGWGDDLLSGGAGDDTLDGANGGWDRRLTGGAGNDLFVLDALPGGGGTVAITDFSAGDVIDVSRFGIADLDSLKAVMVEFVHQGKPAVLIPLVLAGVPTWIRIEGTAIASLTTTDFIFATDPAPRALIGSSGGGVLFGGGGDDILRGLGGRDTLIGGGGADTLQGGAFSDVMVGGAGEDRFVFEYSVGGYGMPFDAVLDFSAGDVVDVTALGVADFGNLRPFLQQAGGDVLLAVTRGGQAHGLVLRNTDLARLTEAQFILEAGTSGLKVTGDWQADLLFGGNGADTISGGGGQDTVLAGGGDDIVSGFSGSSRLFGQDGDDTLTGGGWGNDWLDGGTGNNLLDGGPMAYSSASASWTPVPDFDTASYPGFRNAQLSIQPVTDAQGAITALTVTRRDPGGAVLGTDTLVGIERLETSDGVVDFGANYEGLFRASSRQAAAGSMMLGQVYDGPVAGLQWQLLGGDDGEIVIGTSGHDFINALAGDDAVDAGSGRDVIDGGTGSNFLTGGAGTDTFFLDGRGGATTWSTITDWQAGEQLSLWGYRPGTSLVSWVAEDGTAGYRGVTLHADLDGNGAIETSVTWTSRAQADLPAPLRFDGLLWFT